MIEIIEGTMEGQIIKIRQKTYPITVYDLEKSLRLSKTTILRTLKKLQARNIIKLEPLPDKTYIRLLRNDFRFIGKKYRHKSINDINKNKKQQKTKEHERMMYT